MVQKIHCTGTTHLCTQTHLRVAFPKQSSRERLVKQEGEVPLDLLNFAVTAFFPTPPLKTLFLLLPDYCHFLADMEGI